MMKYIKSFVIAIFIIMLMNNSAQLEAQYINYCSSNNITDIAWSPNGELLAVMTPQAIFIYNQSLELIRSIVVPSVYIDEYPNPAAVWSPDSQWIVVGHRVPVEFLGDGGIAGTSTIVNTNTEEVIARDLPLDIVDRVWSLDNRYILSLRYEPSLMGIQLPYTELILSSGVTEERVESRTKRFDGLHLRNLQWNDSTVFTAQVDGMTISFDSTTLEPIAQAPVFYPTWWVANHDGTREAAMKPDTMFYVHDIGSDEHRVEISGLGYIDDEPISIGWVSKIYWLTDNQRLIGLYSRFFQFLADYPELPRILQGTVVDAEAATEINHFLIYADSEIERYSISELNGTIAIVRNDTLVELWNPFTEEKFAEIEVPFLELGDICPE
jgi:hypothetical protein